MASDPATQPPGLEAAVGAASGVLPAQSLREAVTSGWITAGDWRIPPESMQPASWICVSASPRGRCAAASCPTGSTVEEKIEDLAFEQIDLRDGATLERDRPYLVPLIEQLRFPRRFARRPTPRARPDAWTCSRE